jgi:hypothetical protein
VSAATTTERTGIITVGGRDYATPAAWSRMTPNTSADQVRRAAGMGVLGLDSDAVPVSPGGKIKAYPVDLLHAWEESRRDPGGRPSGDLSTVAAELGVSKMRVWRAVNAGIITGEKDTLGVWRLDLASVEAWRKAGMPAPRADGHR